MTPPPLPRGAVTLRLDDPMFGGSGLARLLALGTYSEFLAEHLQVGRVMGEEGLTYLRKTGVLMAPYSPSPGPCARLPPSADGGGGGGQGPRRRLPRHVPHGAAGRDAAPSTVEPRAISHHFSNVCTGLGLLYGPPVYVLLLLALRY